MASTPGTDDGRTPLRTIRVPDDVWEHAKRCAEQQGTSVSAYVVSALRRWRLRS